MHEGLDGLAGVVVVILGLDKDAIAVFEPDGAHFGVLPSEVFDFGVEIERQEAKIVPSEIVFTLGIAEADDELHVMTSFRVVRGAVRKYFLK